MPIPPLLLFIDDSSKSKSVKQICVILQLRQLHFCATSCREYMSCSVSVTLAVIQATFAGLYHKIDIYYFKFHRPMTYFATFRVRYDQALHINLTKIKLCYDATDLDDKLLQSRGYSIYIQAIYFQLWPITVYSRRHSRQQAIQNSRLSIVTCCGLNNCMQNFRSQFYAKFLIDALRYPITLKYNQHNAVYKKMRYIQVNIETEYFGRFTYLHIGYASNFFSVHSVKKIRYKQNARAIRQNYSTGCP